MRWILLIAAGICLAASAVARETIVIGRVVGVHDGDTITVLVDGKESLKIRLNGIDAPETKQPFGARAKEELSGLVFGKTVEVTVQATDRYERLGAFGLATLTSTSHGARRHGVVVYTCGREWWCPPA